MMRTRASSSEVQHPNTYHSIGMSSAGISHAQPPLPAFPSLHLKKDGSHYHTMDSNILRDSKKCQCEPHIPQLEIPMALTPTAV
jgi:hypothetical protein